MAASDLDRQKIRLNKNKPAVTSGDVICHAFHFSGAAVVLSVAGVSFLKHAPELCRRSFVRSCFVLLCNFRGYISYGPKSTAVVAAAAVVSMDQRSLDYVVAASSTGELTESEFNSPGSFLF